MNNKRVNAATKKKWWEFQLAPTPFIVSLICAMFFLSIAHYTPAFAKMDCSNEEEVGPYYFNFDQLIINLVDFPSPAKQQEKKYPDALKFDAFVKLISDEVRKNLGPCMVTETGEYKSITIIENSNLNQHLRDAGYTSILNPKNLTIAISVNYWNTSSDGQSVIAWIQRYRPNVEEKFRVPDSFSTTIMALDIGKNKDLKPALQRLVQSVGLKSSVIRPDVKEEIETPRFPITVKEK